MQQSRSSRNRDGRLKTEPGTTSAHVMALGDRVFAIFNTFADDEALDAHVNGSVAKWVMAEMPAIFEGPPQITRSRIFAVKLPKPMV
jgi:quinol monooxygenase YgiN